MAKITLTSVGGGYNATTNINANNALIEEAFENTLSRDGTTPNVMEADIDLNSNRLINLGPPVNPNDAARLIDLTGAQLDITTVATPEGNLDKVLISNDVTATWNKITDDNIDAAAAIQSTKLAHARTAAEVAAPVTPVNLHIPSTDDGAYVIVERMPGSDDLAKVANAISVAQAGQTIYFDRLYTCDDALPQIATKAGITFKCPTSCYVTSPQKAGLLFTNTGASGVKLVDFYQCENINLDMMDIRYSNAGFAGKLVSFDQSARCGIKDSNIGGNGVTSALYVLELTGAIGTKVTKTGISGAQYLVFGGSGSNGNTLDTCNYDRYTSAAIYNPFESWTIIGGFCENRVDTLGAFITMDGTAQCTGLTVKGVWMGDASGASAFTWITLGIVNGCEISGNHISGNASLAATGFKLLGTSKGVSVKGNHFVNLAYGIDLNGMPTSFDVYPNSYSGVTTKVTGIPQTSASGIAQLADTVTVKTGSENYYSRTQTVNGAGPWANDASLTNVHVLNVTTSGAFTISNPSNQAGGNQTISVKVVNSGGGAMGAITWGTNYRMATWTNPAVDTSRTIDFAFNGALWVEKSRTPADVPN